MIRTVAVPLLSLALAGCAVAPLSGGESPLFADRHFAPPSQPVDAARVFEASDAMRRYIAEEIGELAGARGKQQALVYALRENGQLRLEYDAAYTRNAAEAFEARTGNCLSLVIMTAAWNVGRLQNWTNQKGAMAATRRYGQIELERSILLQFYYKIPYDI